MTEPTGRPGGRALALRLRPRSAVALGLVSVLGLAAFGWPLLVDPGSGLAHSSDAPWLFVVLLPLILLVMLAELSEGSMDAKAVALLGVLAAIGGGLRVLSTGTAGLELVFVLLVLAGYALGPGFGFALGMLALLAGALITGGVGPWLPFQMLGAGWVGLGAGLLPQARGRVEIIVVASYGAVAGILFGLLLNMWFWPFATYLATSLSFVPGDSLADNLTRFLLFHLATSLGWDIPRAVLTSAMCLLAGRPILNALRRAARRAAFEAPVEFADAKG